MYIIFSSTFDRNTTSPSEPAVEGVGVHWPWNTPPLNHKRTKTAPWRFYRNLGPDWIGFLAVGYTYCLTTLQLPKQLLYIQSYKHTYICILYQVGRGQIQFLSPPCFRIDLEAWMEVLIICMAMGQIDHNGSGWGPGIKCKTLSTMYICMYLISMYVGTYKTDTSGRVLWVTYLSSFRQYLLRQLLPHTHMMQWM